jgi:Uma2 family endonuclease
MWPLVKAKDSGTVVQEMLFILDADRDLRRRPDVAFVSADRWPLDRALPETGDWLVVPNLAVEVVSPNDLVADLAAKIREYFHYGVEQLWVILPSERKVYVYDSPTQVRILGAEEDLEGERLLPGFRLALSTLFQKPASVAESTSK